MIKSKLVSACRCAVLAVVAMGLTACGGGSVNGNTYVDNGSVVKIEFKSDGKAYVSTGPVTTTCSYTEKGKTVSMTCEGDQTDFTVDDDGALNGPPGGMLARLTKQK